MADSKSWQDINYSGVEKYVKDALRDLWEKGGEKMYEKYPEKRPFTIEATKNNTKIYFQQSIDSVYDELDPLKVDVSTDNGQT